MAEAVIVAAVRSPIGKRDAALCGVHPADLSAQVLNGLVDKAGVDPEIVDDVIWGCFLGIVNLTGAQPNRGVRIG